MNLKDPIQMQWTRTDQDLFLRKLHFESKPLGFGAKQLFGTISVDNVPDRGPAYEQGVLVGWRIVKVNEQESAKSMMDELHNTNGPFDITFDTMPTEPEHL